MKRVLKSTGSICLHADPTAGHYLKLLLDEIFGAKNFRNEIIWSYQRWTGATKHFQRMHDTIFFYAMSDKAKFNTLMESYSEKSKHKGSRSTTIKEGRLEQQYTGDKSRKKAMRDVWEISYLNSQSKERVGYPTQKPVALLSRIVKALSDKGDLVLDPFCGCGTTVCAAEELGRNWIGIDISNFSVGLIRDRLLNQFKKLSIDDIESRGLPCNKKEAEELADKDKFEFEKWVCGAIGAHGMFKEPGARGADGGVDGVIEFGLFTGLRHRVKVEKSYAIVQVKGGKVSTDSVRALYSTVRKYGASAGILVCFAKHMRTVNNNRNEDTYKDATGEYPVIQGFSVEQLLKGEKPKLPQLLFREGARLESDLLDDPGHGLI